MVTRRSPLALCLALTLLSPAASSQNQPSVPAPRRCQVVGIWTTGTWVTDFSADGRWQTYYTREQARRASPAIQGTFSVDGATMHFRTTDNVFRYRVTLTGNECESMRLVLMGDDRQQYAPGYTINFQRVLEAQQ